MYWKICFLKNIYFINLETISPFNFYSILIHCHSRLEQRVTLPSLSARRRTLPSCHGRRASFPPRCGGRDVIVLLVDEEGSSVWPAWKEAVHTYSQHASTHIISDASQLLCSNPPCQKDHIDGESMQINMSSNIAFRRTNLTVQSTPIDPSLHRAQSFFLITQTFFSNLNRLGQAYLV